MDVHMKADGPRKSSVRKLIDFRSGADVHRHTNGCPYES